MFDTNAIIFILSHGHTDSSVLESSCKINLCRHLRWEYTRCPPPQKKKTFQGSFQVPRGQYPVFHWLRGCYKANWCHSACTWAGWPNDEKVASTYMQIWSRAKWAHINASALKLRPMYHCYIFGAVWGIWKSIFSVQNMCARVASVEVAFLITSMIATGPNNIDRQRAIASKWHLLCWNSLTWIKAYSK